jgi:DNA-binding LacI/PurR family transcriptional regulator
MNWKHLKVINDNEQASFEAVSHMIKQGYKRVALLEGPKNSIFSPAEKWLLARAGSRMACP